MIIGIDEGEIAMLRSKFSRPFLGKLTLRDICFTVLPLSVAAVVCFALQPYESDVVPAYVSLLFVLAVLCVSRLTDGYLYGIVASLLATICVNYAFTYPYFAFNFTITGYPLTFLLLLVVSISVSMLTTQIKRQRDMRVEIETEKMRANLLRAVSHDIRTPLTSIVGAAEAYLESGERISEERKTELIRGVREEAQWLVRVVENLLSVTRMSGAEANLHKQTEAVEEIVGEAAQKFKKRFPNYKVTLQVPDELLLVPMDATLIEQVIVNLMENAVDHGEHCQHIGLTVSQEQDRAVFAVTDDGCGIAPEILPVMFDGTFRRADQSDTDGKRNMGIGLSVCLSIVRAHGGSMSAENRPEGGACVRFTLPMEETT